MFPTIEFYNRNSGKMWDNKLGLCFKSIKFPVKKNKGMKLLLTMGRLCYKGAKEEHRSNKEKGLKNSSKILLDSSSQDEALVEVDSGYSDASSKPKSTHHSEQSVGSKSNHALHEKNSRTQMLKEEVSESVQVGEEPRICRVLSVRNGNDGAQVVAGWPSWLTAVAGEAIKGWIPRRAESFEKMDKIGQGTYSSVYRARDLETKKIVALKKVRFINMDPESVRFMAREILILRRLDHPNVMKLEGLVTSKVSGNLYLVFEYMEHDLAGLAASSTVKFTEAQIKCYMNQLFCGLEHCHNRGVLHRDIKGANLLIDNDGNLKIGDFGLATFYRANQKQALTSRVVTLWYRPPELLLGSTEYGVAVDLWSSGCILAEMFTGKPIMPGRTEVEQLHKIFKLCGSPPEEYWSRSNIPHSTIFKPQQPYKRCVAEEFKDFPSSALALVQSLLAFEPESRGSATSALNSVFFTTNPLPCNPSSLPKYPPSKELDAKARNEDARRQKRMSRTKSSENGSKESKALAALNANEEQQLLEQKWKGQTSINPKEENVSRKGSLGDRQMVMDEVPEVVLKNQRSYRATQATAARLSKFSNSVASGGGCCSQLDFSNRNVTANSHWPLNNDAESSHFLLGRQDFPYKKNNGQMPRKETTTGYALKKTRIHYSGPLLPHGSSVEEMLKEHEKQIQIAVRKAREKSNKPQER